MEKPQKKTSLNIEMLKFKLLFQILRFGKVIIYANWNGQDLF